MTDIEKKTQDYEFYLCSLCRECGYVYGQDKPCQHIIDAKHGFKDGYKKGFLEGCESFKKKSGADFKYKSRYREMCSLVQSKKNDRE